MGQALRRKLVLVPCFFITLAACSSHTAATSKAAIDLESSVIVGETYLDFEQKLHVLGSAIALERRKGASERLLHPYVEAFDIYKDSSELWRLKIDCPAEFMESGTECGIVDETVEDLARKYGVEYKGSTIREAWLHKNVGVPFERQDSYPKRDVRRANREVFPRLLIAIWNKAAQTLAESPSF